MAWETITTQLSGRGGNVSVAWRVPGGRTSACLAVSMGSTVAAKFGLAKRARVMVQRDRMAGKLRITLAPAGTGRHETRCPAWKGNAACITVPLEDVKLTGTKPAQDVPWEFDADGAIVLRLPHWACPLIQVSGGRAA